MKSNPAVSANLHAPEFRDATAAGSLAARAIIIELSGGKVIRLEKSSRLKRIEVNRGVIWLTGTPAKGDLLVREGGQYDLRNNWPFVIEALEDAKLSLS